MVSVYVKPNVSFPIEVTLPQILKYIHRSNLFIFSKVQVSSVQSLDRLGRREDIRRIQRIEIFFGFVQKAFLAWVGMSTF